MKKKEYGQPTEWFSAEEAGEYLRVSRATIYRLTQQGELPAFYIGRLRRYRKLDLDGVPLQEDAETNTHLP